MPLQEELTLIEVANSRQPGNPDAALVRLLESNQGLIAKLARRFTVNSSLPYDDAKQEASLGFLRAVQLFKPEKGCRLSTYAVVHIIARLGRARQQCSVIRVPHNQSDARLTLRREQDRLEQELGRPGTEDELIGRSVFSEQKVRALLNLPDSVLSLDYLLGQSEEPDTIFLDFLHSTEPGPEELFSAQEGPSPFYTMVMDSFRSPTERDLVQRRFGLPPYDEPQSLQVISEACGLSREGVRIKIARILNSIREMLAEGDHNGTDTDTD